MIRPLTHERLLAHGLTTGTGCVRRSADGTLVAYLDAREAEHLVDRLERGMPLEHAVRAVKALDVSILGRAAASPSLCLSSSIRGAA